MSDLKRIPLLAILLIVLVRLAIGWQFLYEGMWKYDTLKTPTPWTAKGYLANAEGPWRDHFRSMVGDFPQGNDPHDLLWLDLDTVNASWDRWRDRFIAHYGLDHDQQTRLNTLLDGLPSFSSAGAGLPKLTELPSGVPADFKGISAKISLKDGALVVDGSTPLTPTEFDRLLVWIGVVMTDRVEDGQLKPTLAVRSPSGDPELDDTGNPVRIEDDLKRTFVFHVNTLKTRQAQSLGIRQKLRASLKGDPERAGVYLVDGRGVMGTPPADAKQLDLINYGDIQKYKQEVADYDRFAARASMPHEFEHLSRLRTKLNSLKASVVGPVKALDNDLKDKARAILTTDQLQRGPVPQEPTPLVKASQQAMWALILFGCLLLVGFCTRLAAIGGAVMLMSFYLVVPPWPGVPEPLGTTEHSFIVNKNMIEAMVLLVIAALPTGSWFGLDGVFRWLFSSRKAVTSP